MALCNLCECIFRSLVVNCVVYKWLCVRTGAVLPLSNVVIFSFFFKILAGQAIAGVMSCSVSQFVRAVVASVFPHKECQIKQEREKKKKEEEKKQKQNTSTRTKNKQWKVIKERKSEENLSPVAFTILQTLFKLQALLYDILLGVRVPESET